MPRVDFTERDVVAGTDDDVEEIIGYFSDEIAGASSPDQLLASLNRFASARPNRVATSRYPNVPSARSAARLQTFQRAAGTFARTMQMVAERSATYPTQFLQFESDPINTLTAGTISIDTSVVTNGYYRYMFMPVAPEYVESTASGPWGLVALNVGGQDVIKTVAGRQGSFACLDVRLPQQCHLWPWTGDTYYSNQPPKITVFNNNAIAQRYRGCIAIRHNPAGSGMTLQPSAGSALYRPSFTP